MPEVTPCTTNADCANFLSGDGPTCCVHPLCICGVSNLGASANLGCVDESGVSDDNINRVDDDFVTTPPIIIGPTTSSLRPTPSPPVPSPISPPPPTPTPTKQTTPPTPSPIVNPPLPTASGRTCPSLVSDLYQDLPEVTPCTTNADCANFLSGDGPTCCVHPLCICGVSNLGASANLGCVDESNVSDDDINRVDDDINRVDDDFATTPPIIIGPTTSSLRPTPSPPVSPPIPPPIPPPVPLPVLPPAPSPPPTPTPTKQMKPPTPFPIVNPPLPTSSGRSCPSTISFKYQDLPDVTPCITNADCANFISGDGPTCCVHPLCICGVSNLGASANLGCVDT